MSEENIEIVLDGIRRFEAGDFEGMAATFHPDGFMTPPEGWPEPGPFIGREAVAAQYRQIQSQFDSHRFEVKNVKAVGDWVVLDYRWMVRGAGSGAEVEFDVTVVSRFEDGLVREAHHRWDHGEALKAAGLSE